MKRLVLAGHLHSDPQGWATLMLMGASVCPRKGERVYLLPVCHPVSEAGNQDGTEQDLRGVVDQEWD